MTIYLSFWFSIC